MYCSATETNRFVTGEQKAVRVHGARYGDKLVPLILSVSRTLCRLHWLPCGSHMLIHHDTLTLRLPGDVTNFLLTLLTTSRPTQTSVRLSIILINRDLNSKGFPVFLSIKSSNRNQSFPKSCHVSPCYVIPSHIL